MTKIILSTLTVITLGTLSVNAMDIYQDANGQLFSSAAEGRTLVGKTTQITPPTTPTPKANAITIINQKSPDFLLGKETHINMKFVPQDAPDMWFKAGIRLQGTFENINTDYNDVTKQDTRLNDAYLRRVRLEVAAGFGEHASFTMDIRNDKSNYGIENDEGSFNVGDAYVKIKKPFNTSLINFKLYRAKIDVSRTETVKSARVIAYDRPYIADAAAQYISFNRRGANAQMYGDWQKKIHYQVAFGASTNPDKVKDAQGNKGDDIKLDEQSFFFGGKVKLSPFDGWEELQNTETYMGVGKHFTLGAAYWMIPTMKGHTNDGTVNEKDFNLNRSLINVEASAHYKGLMVQAEYFKFNDVIKDVTTTSTLEIGKSSGWYATSEYVFTDFYYLAPFVRYESWDRFENEDGHDVTSALVGLNWYLRGNTTKVGLVAQKDTYGVNAGDKDVTKFRITSQWFF